MRHHGFDGFMLLRRYQIPVAHDGEPGFWAVCDDQLRSHGSDGTHGFGDTATSFGLTGREQGCC